MSGVWLIIKCRAGDDVKDGNELARSGSGEAGLEGKTSRASVGHRDIWPKAMGENGREFVGENHTVRPTVEPEGSVLPVVDGAASDGTIGGKAKVDNFLKE